MKSHTRGLSCVCDDGGRTSTAGDGNALTLAQSDRLFFTTPFTPNGPYALSEPVSHIRVSRRVSVSPTDGATRTARTVPTASTTGTSTTATTITTTTTREEKQSTDKTTTTTTSTAATTTTPPPTTTTTTTTTSGNTQP